MSYCDLWNYWARFESLGALHKGNLLGFFYQLDFHPPSSTAGAFLLGGEFLLGAICTLVPLLLTPETRAGALPLPCQ